MKKYEEMEKLKETIAILKDREIELEGLIRDSNNVSVKIITRSTLEKTRELLALYCNLLRREERLRS